MNTAFQLKILNVSHESHELRVECLGCHETFIWSEINQSPDFCPLCGQELASDLYVNPEQLEVK